MIGASRLAGWIGKYAINTRTIAALRAGGAPALAALGSAFEWTMSASFDGADREGIARIERIRSQLEARDDVIEVMDFGSGAPGDAVRAPGGFTLNRETVGHACRSYSRDWATSLLLYNIVRALKPAAALELGACLGLSAAYQALALRRNGGGRLVTLEGAPEFARIAGETLAALGIETFASVVVGPFRETLPAVLPRLKPVDYIFVDGHHEEDATVDYFRLSLPFLAETAVLVFDDIAWSQGMRNAWARIAADAAVDVSVTLSAMGVCVVGVPAKARHRLILG